MSPVSPLPMLRAFREAAGMTQQQLADAAGVRQATVSALENGGHADALLSVLWRLSTALGVPLALLVDDPERHT